MTLRLNCTLCGASIIADDLAIRHELVTCSYCSTILRITQKGTQEYKDSILARDAPPGVSVKREGPGKISISALRTQRASVINRPEFVRGTKIGVAVAAAISVLGVLCLLPMFSMPVAVTGMSLLCLISLFFITVIPAVIVSIFAVGALQKNLAPLRLKDGIIYPSVASSGQVATDNIQQIYAAITNVLSGGRDQPFVSCMVCALTRDGNRIPLLGPLNNKEMTLYVEEILEAEIGIFNLPVYGDADIPGQAGSVIPESPAMAQIKGPKCESCGAELSETPEARRRGFLVCDYCEGLVLLYEPGTSKPILGIPDPNSPTFRYRIEAQPDGLAILFRNTPTELIRVSHGQLRLTGPGGSVRTLAATELANLQVKETDMVQGGNSDWGTLARIFKTLGKAMAYSGDVDPQKVVLQAAGLKVFRIVVKDVDGHEICLLDGIQDPREAFFLAKSLKKAFKL